MIAAHQSPVVFCDANVLYGSLLRDLLMWLGVRRNLRLRWTVQVQEEWTRNLLAHRPDLLPEQLVRTCEQMNRAIPDALVPAGREEESYDLPDPADRHVVEAALAAGARVIVTANLRDFPRGTLAAVGLEARHPDEVLLGLWRAEPEAVARVVDGVHARAVALGAGMARREMLKRVRLPRLAKALG